MVRGKYRTRGIYVPIYNIRIGTNMMVDILPQADNL